MMEQHTDGDVSTMAEGDNTDNVVTIDCSELAKGRYDLFVRGTQLALAKIGVKDVGIEEVVVWRGEDARERWSFRVYRKSAK